MVDQTPPRDRPDTIANYELGGQLGSGGMGEVYEATDTRNGARVAVKLLHPHLAADETFRDRFIREAHVASLLRSPYTVPLLDSGVDEGRYFLVMRFVEGQTVREALRAGPMAPARALDIAAQVARSLEEAELRGIVHRDIKPDNVMLREPGDTAQVMDFGIARQVGAATVTSTGAFIGTPLYAAPEASGGRPDHRSDIYSLGATLYHMLAGRPPFEGEPLEVLRQHRETPVPFEPLAGLPADVRDALARCMEKDPAERYQSASDLAGVFEHLAAAASERGYEALDLEPTVAVTGTEAPPADAGAVTITVSPGQLRPTFVPGASKNRYDLEFRNSGDRPIEFSLAASNDTDTLEFQLPARVTIPSEETATVTLEIRPRRRRWRGGTRSHSFSVSASASGGGPPIIVSGEFEDRPERWAPVAGGALFSLAALALLMTIGNENSVLNRIRPTTTVPSESAALPLTLAQYFQQIEELNQTFEIAIGEAVDEFDATIAEALRQSRSGEAIDAAYALLAQSIDAFNQWIEVAEGIEPPPATAEPHLEMIASTEAWRGVIETIAEQEIGAISTFPSALSSPQFVSAAQRVSDACEALREIAVGGGIALDLNCAAARQAFSGTVNRIRAITTAAAESAAGQPESVSILLGVLNEESGLSHPTGGDGLTEPSERAGRSCRELRTNGSLVRYAYFEVTQPPTTPPLEVTVEYFDEGNFLFWVEYDGPSADEFASSTLASLEGTETWRTHTFDLPDANFGKADYVFTEYGIVMDFRVAATEAEPALCVRQVTVRRQGPLLRVRFTTTSDVFEARPVDVADLVRITVIEPAEPPQGWIATKEHVRINQSVANASAGRAIELVIHMRLALEALTTGVGFDVQHGGIGSARVQFFAVTDDSAQLIKTVMLQAATQEGVPDPPRRIGVTAAELQAAFPAFTSALPRPVIRAHHEAGGASAPDTDGRAAGGHGDADQVPHR